MKGHDTIKWQHDIKKQKRLGRNLTFHTQK